MVGTLAAIALLLHRRTRRFEEQEIRTPCRSAANPPRPLPQSKRGRCEYQHPGAAPGGTPDAGAAGQAGPPAEGFGSGTGNALVVRPGNCP